MNKYEQIQRLLRRLCYGTGILTSVIATYIMLAHYYGFHNNTESIGFFAIPIAFFVNLSVLIAVGILADRNGVNWPFWPVFSMVMNIPLAMVYLWFAFYLTSYYRVTVINDTPHRITQIRLTGCDQASLPKLDTGEEETIWIELDNDCSLRIDYKNHLGKKRHDIIAGYLSTSMGIAEEYHISGKDNPKY